MLRLRSTARLGRTRLLLLVIAVPVALLFLVLFFVFQSSRRALQRVTLSAQSAGELAFTLRPLDPIANRARSAGFEPVDFRPEFTRGAFLAGALYLAGPAGLSRIDPSGTSTLQLRTGLELPVAPITALTTGRLRGASEPQLLLATAGSGLLLLQPNAQDLPTLRNLLPANADARDLTSLLVLPSGDLLLGTRHHGLLLYNGTQLLHLPIALPGIDSTRLQISALAAVDAASYLVGTRNAGVFLVRGGTVQQATAATGMPDNDIESLAVAYPHAFVGTPTGTAQFDLSSTAFTPERTLAPGTFSNALSADDRFLTIGTIDQGVQDIPLDQHATLRRVAIAADPAPGSLQRVDAFLSTPTTLYALADGHLLRRDRGAWTPLLPTTPTTLTDRNISALAFAEDGTLYIGYFDHGIDLLSPQNTVRHLEDDHLFCINRLALDPVRHTIAAATGDGLVLFDAQGTPRQTLMRRDGLISDHVTDVAFTSNGMALATPAGITFLGTTGPESLYAFQGLVNNHVYALASNAPDTLLAGTLGGLSLLRSRAVQRSFTVNNSTLGHNWITALLPLPRATTLVGTYGAGLETLDAQGHFTAVALPGGTPHDLVINPNALYATATHLFAGTLGHGMLVYSEAAGRWSTLTAGLPSLNVTSFAARNGELYVGTDNGLMRIAEANLP